MENNKRKALGMGLEQLFNSEQVSFNALEQNIVETASKNDIKQIKISEIRSNPYQPRQHFDEQALYEMSQSIKEFGVLEPIIVKKSVHGYELVAGERRTKASALAGLETIPAIIKDFTDQEMMDLALLENIQREDLSPIELANGFQKYIESTGLTQEEIAKKFGKSRSYITNILGLLSLPINVRNLINANKISMSHARVLSKLEDEDLIQNLTNKIVTEGISVRELEKLCSQNVQKKKPINRTTNVPLEYNIYEKIMRDKIGTKVQISKNKIQIPFDSIGDLKRVLEILDINVSDE